jgi:pyruvate/2-oxoglutarate dehydrogenase complex dihydrolipoamide dehydrogenase (E3) component
LAAKLAQSGRRTVIVERSHVGGSCINYGCTPTKTMAASARVAYLARRAADYGVMTSGVEADLGRIRQRKDKVVESFRQGSQASLEQTDGLELIFGHGRFIGHRKLAVDLQGGGERRFEAAWVFINTGGRPYMPPIEGLGACGALDSTTIMECEQLPGHLLVLGGGYIGLEFGQMFRRFGSDVTIIERGNQLLSREDADVAEAMAEILKDDGLSILLNSEALGVKREGDALSLRLHNGSVERIIKGTHLLVATGRVPATDGLNLKAGGIETDERGFIKVDDQLETSAPGVFALGDVKGGPAFTHISYDDYRTLRTNLLGLGHARARDRILSYTIFTDPQLGRAGISEKEARAGNLDVRIAKLPMSKAARAIETGETRGFMKALVDAKSGKILGCAVLAMEGGELMGALQIAMMGGLEYTDLRDTPFAHPTLVESFNNLFKTLDN